METGATEKVEYDMEESQSKVDPTPISPTTPTDGEYKIDKGMSTNENSGCGRLCSCINSCINCLYKALCTSIYFLCCCSCVICIAVPIAVLFPYQPSARYRVSKYIIDTIVLVINQFMCYILIVLVHYQYKLGK